MDAELIQALAKISVPPKPARVGWHFDQTAILRACRLLEINKPIYIRFSSGRRTRGTHRHSHPNHAQDRVFGHNITVSQLLDAETANQVLWHELAHAMQAEAWERSTDRPAHFFYAEEYSHPEAQGPWGFKYHENIYEVHARKVSEKMAPMLNLIRG
jgi:hypothetical protein